MLVGTGYATIFGDRTTEADTRQCVHCNAHCYSRSTDPKIECDPGGTCRNCMGWICSKCLAKECLNFEKKLTIYERRQDLFKKLGLEL